MTSWRQWCFSALSHNASLVAVTTIGTILGIAFGSYFYLQAVAVDSTQDALLEQQEQRQIDNTKALSRHISSDLDSIVLRLQLLASQSPLQRGELASQETTRLLEKADSELREITAIQGIAIIDEDNIYVNNSVEELRKVIGIDRSNTEYAIETRKDPRPYISSGFAGASGAFGIAVSVPIINEETGSYIGIIVVGLPTSEYFERFGNVVNPESQVIVAVDRSGNYLSVIPQSNQYLGENVFSENVQKNLIKGNPELNRMYTESVKMGRLSYTTFDVGVGERFAAASPVFYKGEQVMTVVQSIPIAAIYSQVDSILTATTLRGTILLSAVSAAVIILIIFIIRWNKSLDKAVIQRTAELKESNEKLAEANSALSEYNVQLGNAFEMVVKANEQLEAHDKMQKEFINIAAHELRTPVQPLLGVTEMLELASKDAEKIEISRAELEMIIRNVKRLERLSSDILEVSRIESKSLTLHKTEVDLNEQIVHAVEDAKSSLASKQLEMILERPQEPIHLEADKHRLYEVTSNLLDNAIKFTDSGIIRVRIEKQDDQAIVSVEDSGAGIDPEIIPRLFTKFVSRARTGTGLGLYLSKTIIEAHGGQIWGRNNPDGKGATFAFSLPLRPSQEITYT